MASSLAKPFIVIPARGGSAGVPRKNVRLLAGEPLIARTIKTALAATLPGRVVVITDDDEIEEISLHYGALVTREEKTTGKATLDQVMVRAVPFLRQLGATDADVLLTMQPTCPFITSSRVREAMKAFGEGAGSVLTVIDDRHLGWRLDEGGNPRPDYAARVNRQQLPPHFRESGAIIGARIGDVIKFETRIIEPIRLIELPEGEALDIDTFGDWAIAEHLATRRRILLRTDAARELGMGHAYRTLALAYALARHDLTIVLSANKPLGVGFFQEYPFKIETVEDDLGFLNLARKARADLIVLDQLDTHKELVALLGETAKIVTFEDLGSGAEQADLLVADLYENPNVPSERQLTGVQNSILAPSFESLPRKTKFRENAEDVLLLFGGTDPSNLAIKALESLQSIHFKGRVTLVRGLGASLVDPAKFGNLNLQILSNVKNMPALMVKADIAISSAGRTITELSCIGVPTLCLAQNAKELTHTHTTVNNGVIMLGLGSLVSVETLGAHISKLCDDAELRRTLHERALNATAGRNNTSIVARIMRKLGL
jgi:spore coat polysaccharide biosynthesis predicted glycosyltransferase SpsG/CMP-N-acetylneuraminic acid synthetase